MKKMFDIQIVADVDSSGVLKNVGADVSVRHSRMLSEHELMTVSALIAYKCHVSGVRASLLEWIICTTYGLDAVAELPSAQYQEVVEWLIDIDPAHFVN